MNWRIEKKRKKKKEKKRKEKNDFPPSGRGSIIRSRFSF